jgi:16S rRNA (uracil1498-N3)-methyltransferase
VLRVPVSRLVPGELLLDKGASRYVARVHRIGAGQSILLFDPAAASEGEATVLSVDRGGVMCRVRSVHPARVRALRRVTLLQAIGKGDKVDAVVRDATELGATRVIAVKAERSVVRLGQGQERLARWRRIAAEAARQCGRGDAPEILGPLELHAALALAREEGALMLCLFEHATEPAGPRLRALGAGTPLVVLIGPEGGLTEEEVFAARASGFAITSLGPLILRTETAATAVLGAALLLGA